MSSSASPRLRTARPESAKSQKRLRIVAPPKGKATGMPFVVLVIVLFAAGLIGLIFLSTVLQSQAFTIAELHREARALETSQSAIVHDLARQQSPSSVAAAALALGMVPNTNPVFLRLSDGKVIGEPLPAKPKTNVKRVDN